MTRPPWTRAEIIRLLAHLQAVRFVRDFTGGAW